MLRRLRHRVLARATRLSLLQAARLQHVGEPPDLSGTIEVETTFARLLVHADDEVITPTLRATGGWDPGETAVLGERLKPGMTVIDGGAHVGYFTCLAARLVGPRGLVLAFEPSPRNSALLVANIWRNGLSNVVCLPWALGAANGFARLVLSTSNTGDNRLVASADEADGAVAVRVAALDALGLVLPPLDFVKLDLQGSEGPAVAGMRELLAASPDVVLSVEFWPRGIERSGGDAGAILQTYRGLGFSIGTYAPEEKGVEPGLSDAAIIARCRERGGGEGHVNLLLARA
jgi:FkbM family methyltransferase